jgi:UDP-2,3-diacylglucosamine hydrolase
MATYFISDLHLHASRPKTSELFLKFLAEEALTAEALYILGDLFEAWVGHEALDTHDTQIIAALADFSRQGIPVYFMPGNRDFLLSEALLEEIDCRLLNDPAVITLNEIPIILTHGDKLCTLDRSYQRFRAFVQHPLVKKWFLRLPLSWRRHIATALRSNRSHVAPKPTVIPRHWDVSLSSVYQLMREYKAYTLIHGHTHLPGIHEFILDGRPAKRVTLGDWGDTGSTLICDPDTIHLKVIV